MSDRIILGVCGAIGAGKTSVAEILEQNFNFEILHMTDYLKFGVAQIFGWSIARILDREAKELIDPIIGFSPRQVLQVLGTDIMREKFGQDIFVNIMKKRLKDWSADHTVIPDLRFPNEAEMIKSYTNGYIIKVHAPQRLEGVRQSTHESELHYSNIQEDISIQNDGSLEDLEKLVSKVIRGIL